MSFKITPEFTKKLCERFPVIIDCSFRQEEKWNCLDIFMKNGIKDVFYEDIFNQFFTAKYLKNYKVNYESPYFMDFYVEMKNIILEGNENEIH